MDAYVKLSDLDRFPIREDHCDQAHADEHFINGIETVFEYIETLPKTEIRSVEDLMEQIKQIKRSFDSPNADYKTGYLCALSVMEGVLAGALVETEAECETLDRWEIVHHKGDLALYARCKCGYEYNASIFNREKMECEVHSLHAFCPACGSKKDCEIASYKQEDLSNGFL
jgi:hypothetical protein